VNEQQFRNAVANQRFRSIKQYIDDLEEERGSLKLIVVTLKEMAKEGGANVDTLLTMVSFLNRIEFDDLEADDGSTDE